MELSIVSELSTVVFSRISSVVEVVVRRLPNGLRLRVGKGNRRLVLGSTLDSVTVTLGFRVGKGSRLRVL